ncbi:MAG TPA: thioredoxin domain-containing protein [Myxococcales bacterium]|nr:thioredoxin domain-containing protein [Myxococcales bacterium]
MPNRLASEKSPYLRQHAGNPVDWYPWGPEALARARAEDRPILLSIGYSACHWCHVMERESFEDEATAALMNASFVSIKVDREERPDLDDVYQHAVQLLGRHGGWPLTVFLTPAGVPFFGGTYFPPQDRYGMPSFRRILESVAESWRTRRKDIEGAGAELLRTLSEVTAPSPAAGLVTPASWSTAVGRLLARVDPEHGGFGSRPKFPNSMDLEVLWRAAVLDGREDARTAVLRSLHHMADGGLHDQLGGGFHRYSTDERWLVPHFEKMLYDNALLAPLYHAAFLETGDGRLREAGEDALGWAAREMASPAGGFYSTQDADSEGHEGRFFLWTPGQVEAVVGPERAGALCRHLGITAAGNFEGERGENVLTRATPSTPELEEGRRALWAAREQRPKPFRDEKIIAGWNGLAISAFARAAVAPSEGGRNSSELLKVARAAADFARDRLTVDGQLRRSWLDGPGSVPAFAGDHAFLAIAHLDLYEVAFQPRDLARARALGDALLDRFFVAGEAAVAVAASDAEPLVHRPIGLYDNAIPGATSAALEAWQRLAWLTGEARYREAAGEVVRRHVDAMVENPFGFGNLLCGLDRHLRGPVEVVVAGALADPRTQALLAAARSVWLPNRALAHVEPGAAAAPLAKELWEGRTNPSAPTCFVCRDGACLAPLTDPADLPAALRQARRSR